MAKENIMISVRLTPEDFALLTEKCQAQNITRSTYIREMIRHGAVYVVESPHELILEVSRIGNNLNQIVRQMHYGLLDGIKEDIHSLIADFASLKRSAHEIAKEVSVLCRF